MTDPDAPRFIEVRNGDYTVAAEVAAAREAGGTARAWLHAASGHVAPGRRADSVDAVIDLPEVQASARLEATVPLGDSESRLAAGGTPVLRGQRWLSGSVRRGGVMITGILSYTLLGWRSAGPLRG